MLSKFYRAKSRYRIRSSIKCEKEEGLGLVLPDVNGASDRELLALASRKKEKVVRVAKPLTKEQLEVVLREIPNFIKNLESGWSLDRAAALCGFNWIKARTVLKEHPATKEVIEKHYLKRKRTIYGKN